MAPNSSGQEFRWERQDSCVEKNLSNFALRIKDVNVFLVDDKAKNQLRNDFRRRLTKQKSNKASSKCRRCPINVRTFRENVYLAQSQIKGKL